MQDQLLLQLAEAVDNILPPEELRARWRKFQDSLLGHFDAEERLLFAVFAQGHRAATQRLRAEHRTISQAAAALSASIEQNTLQRSAVEELLSLLRAHTQHEARTLHCWLEQDEGSLARRRVLAFQQCREGSTMHLESRARRG